MYRKVHVAIIHLVEIICTQVTSVIIEFKAGGVWKCFCYCWLPRWKDLKCTLFSAVFSRENHTVSVVCMVNCTSQCCPCTLYDKQHIKPFSSCFDQQNCDCDPHCFTSSASLSVTKGSCTHKAGKKNRRTSAFEFLISGWKLNEWHSLSIMVSVQVGTHCTPKHPLNGESLFNFEGYFFDNEGSFFLAL